MQYNGKTHLTIYGNFIVGADISILEKYDVIILSPRNLEWVAENAPQLLPRCYLYVDFYVSPRMHINEDYGFLPCPGDIWPEEEVKEMPSWAGSYMYYVTWEWFALFMGHTLKFLETFTEEHGKIGGMFLDEWKNRSGQAWWGFAQEAMDQLCGEDYDDIREAIENLLLKILPLYVEDPETLLIMNGMEVHFSERSKRYFEGAGSSYNPFNEAIEILRNGDFMQINGTDHYMRYLAKWVAQRIPCHLGMQPNTEAHYKDVEDPDLW